MTAADDALTVPVPTEEGSLRCDDGIRIGYQLFGSGRTIVLANGIGVRYPAFAYQIEALRSAYRIVCWDYRGIGRSPAPNSRDLAPSRHAQDAAAILDHLGIEQAVLAGWSMGVAVSLELARMRPALVRGVVAMFGACGRHFQRAFNQKLARAFVASFAQIRRYPLPMTALLRGAVVCPQLTRRLLSGVRFVGPHVDPRVFAAAVCCVAEADMRVYAETMLALTAHDSAPYLHRLACPLLVLSAEHDHIAPPRLGQAMVAAAPNATHELISGASHFALMEFPERVNQLLVEFAETTFLSQTCPRPPGADDETRIG